MAVNLVKAGHDVVGFDLSAESLQSFVKAGGTKAASANAAAAGADVIVTMLPAGKHVKQVYLGDDGLIAAATGKPVLIDCSTIDVASAREVAEAARGAGLSMVDAPVSGGTVGAQAATLTFMVGGPDDAFGAASPTLQAMGKNIIHAGGPGNGAGGKDLQQHDTWHLDDRCERGIRAG